MATQKMAQRMAKPAGKAPVSAHPLFPVIVALWFAALLGIGTMVLPQTLYDAVGNAAGLGSPGLGLRLGIGLVAGFAGAAIGLLMARMAVGSHDAAKTLSRAERALTGKAPGAVKRPISALEELGSDGLDEPIEPGPGRAAPEPFAGRRRALAVTDESAPNEYLTQAPLPGGSDVLDLMGVENLADEQVLELEHPEDDDRPAVQAFVRAPEQFGTPPAAPLHRRAFEPVPGQDTFGAGPFAAPAPEDRELEPHTPAASVGGSLAAGPFAAPDLPRPFSPPPAARAPFAAPAEINRADAPVQSMPPADLPPFPQPSPVAGAPFGMPQPEVPSTPFASAPVSAGFARPAVPVAERIIGPVVANHPSDAIDLAGLGMVALVERFAESLRRASTASATDMAQAAEPAFSIPATAHQPAEPAVQPVSAAGMASPADGTSPPPPFALPPIRSQVPSSLPAALRPFGFDETDEGADEGDPYDDESGHGFSLPLGNVSKPFAAPDASPAAISAAPFSMPQPVDDAAAEAEDAPVDDDHFGSLLAMKGNFAPGREFVRIEEDEEPATGIEPVVVFPGTAQPGRAAPAPDGPSREPATPAPFGRPPFAPPLAPTQAAGHNPFQPADRQATETALRDALAKLQQMSGAA